jgi:hypothetical protein
MVRLRVQTKFKVQMAKKNFSDFWSFVIDLAFAL